MNRHRGWLAGLLSLFLMGAPAFAGAQTLRLNSGVGEPYFQQDGAGFLERLVPEVFRRVGVKAEALRYAASERAMINANSGEDDGVAMRIAGLESIYPNLIRVDEKVIDNDFVAYARQARFATTGFDTLRGYEVGYIHGWKVFEAGVPADVSVTKVKDAAQLFGLLENDRADLVLFERWQGNHILRARNIRAHVLLPPLASTEMFMYLHRKHAHLAEPVARALRAMKADGTYRRIAARTLPDYDGQ